MKEIKNKAMKEIKNKKSIEKPNNGVSRKDFIKTSAFVGGCAAVASQMPWLLRAANGKASPNITSEMAYELSKPENVIYSTCLQCHVACPNKAKIWDGTLAKIDGNPYSPQNYLPHLHYDTPLTDSVKADGKLCAKGQAGVQTYYDPYRLRKVLKRKGERGSGKWETIEWDQFIKEVVDGGKNFSGIGDNRHYPGFKEVLALKDPEVFKAMAADVAKIQNKEMTVDEFKEIHAANLDKLIDPDHPDLGPKNNQFIFNSGRMEHGRKEIRKFFTKNCFGSVNQFDHFSICEESHHIAFSEMTHHKTHHMKIDLANAKFILFWGTGAFSANFGLTPMSEKVTTNKVNNGTKIAVVDPRLSNDAAQADMWLPVTPGTDGALALAMIRWMIENNRFDGRFLENANKAAANADGEPSYTNATHLVRIIDGRPQKLLRANEIGKGSEEEHVVSQNGNLVAVNYEDTNNPVEGDIFVDTEVNGEPVKSSFQIIKEHAFSKTIEEYSKECGVPVKQIIELSREFTSHGKQSAIDFYRGACQHTDGFYFSTLLITLNLMVGNIDWKGGLTKGGGHWHEAGGKPGSVYGTNTKPNGGFKQFGTTITREGSGEYEKSTLFERDGYPAKRPWYPLASGVYQEIAPSQKMGYPYKAKIMYLHKGTPAFSVPGSGHKDISTYSNPDILPLFICSDIVVGETSMFADYIVPDLTYLERWGTPHATPDVPTPASKVRQPVAKPLTEEVKIDGEVMPISMEAFLIAIGKALKLPGVGKDAFGEGLDWNRPEDFFLRAVANIAYGDKENEAVPNASDEEMEIFRKARRHLPKSVFDENKWKKAVSDVEWRKIVYVLNRGGRFANFEDSYDNEYMKKKIGHMFNFFMEDMANRKNSMSGKYMYGYPNYRGQFNIKEEPLVQDTKKFPFKIITFKQPFGGHSRTISNYWSNIGLQPENRLWMNTVDAEKLGLKTDDMVHITSTSNSEGKVNLGKGGGFDTIVKVWVKEGIAPGVVGLSHHYGHWAYGGNDIEVDGHIIKGDKRRLAGLAPNPLFMLDPVLKDVVLSCPVGSSTSYYDSYVAVTKV